MMIAGALALGKVVTMVGRGAVTTPGQRLPGSAAAWIVLLVSTFFFERLVFFALSGRTRTR